MKNRNFLKNSIAILLPISMGIGVLFGTANKHVNSASAYTKDGTLPTTIDLRDNTAQEIKNYYSGLSSLSSSQLQGDNLLKNLKPILKNGQKYFAYDGNSGNDLWKMYEIIDRDWEKSPASAITGYSSSTNKITGYTYGTSTSNKGTNPYIHALYVDRNVDNQTRAWDDHQQNQWGINREHIWPKSQGFNAEGAGGARGDPMHLWAGNGRVNGTEHNNNHYGFVDKSKAYTNPYDAKSFKNLKDNYSGKSLTIPTSTDTVFEPQDCDKGDIARAIFYMVARYNNIAGNDTIDTNNPNLALKQTTQSLTSYTTTSSNKQTGYMGLMTDLLYWNHLDPVDEFEIHRNNLLFNNYTHNRNPFIDYPEWADYIWGKPVYNGRNYVSYSSTPTGSVNLSTDVINGFKGEQPAETTVTSIEVTSKPTKLVYTAGETLNTDGMVVKAHLSNNTTRTLSASDYTVTPSGALTTSNNTVTVTYQGKSASFQIGVKGGGTQGQTKTSVFTFTACPDGWPSGSNSQVLSKSYTIGSDTYTFDLGTNVYYNTSKYLMLKSTTYLGLPALDGYKLTKVVAKNSSGCSKSTSVGISTKNNSASYVSGGAAQTWSTQSSTYTYTLTDTSENTEYFLYITSANCQIIELDLTFEPVSSGTNIDVTSISLNKSGATLEIGTSEQLSATVNPSNATIKLVSWSSSNSSVVEVSDEGEITAKSPGNATITCSALDGSGVTATCAVTVNQPVTLSTISLSGEYPTEFYIGDQFSSDGLVVTANYSDNSQVVVTDDVEITGYDMESKGIQTVTVSYGEKTATYQIEVKEKGLADNEIMFIASQLGLVNSDELTSYTDSVATLTFTKNSGTQPKYYSSTSTFRVYAKNSFTISGTKKITKIEFEMASSDTVGSNAISANVGSLSGTTWTGNESSVVFTVGGTSGQRNIISIKITYDENSEEILALSSISLSGTYKTEYFTNESFSSEGLIVTAHYSDGSESVVTPTSISSPTMSTVGTKTITVTYTENNVTKQASFNIEVSAIVGVSIELTGNYKTDYEVGDDFSTSGMTVVEHKNNGATANHLPSSCTFTGYDLSSPGDQTVTVDYFGLQTTYTIHVTGVAVKTYVATILPSDFTSTSYSDNNKDHTIVAVNKNNAEDTKNIVVTTNQVMLMSEVMQWQSNKGFIYNKSEIGNITSVLVNSSSGTFFTSFGDSAISEHKTANTTTTSGKYFNVSVSSSTGKTSSIVITFTVTEGGSEKELSSIAVSGDYKTSFNVGDDFSFRGTVTATYSDETTEDVTESATFSGYDLSTAGEQTVTVTYDGKTTTYSITVSSSVVPPTPVGGNVYSKIISLDDIEDGAKYIIGYEDGNTLKAMPNEFAKKMAPVELTIDSRMVIDTNNKCFITLESVIKSNTITACITNGTKYLNTSTGTDFTVGTDGQNWVITVDDNGEFLFSNGNRSLIYWAGTTNKFGNYANSNLNQDECNKVSLYKEVINADNYSLVTDPTDLRTGDKIVIAAPNTSYTGVTTYYSLSTNRNIISAIYGCEIDFNNSVVTPSDETELITVERNGNDISFKLSDGKYIASYGSGSAAINLVDSSSDSSARFTATANTDNSIKLISENTDHNYRRLKFNYSTGDRYYRCYTTNSSTGVDPMIFKYQPQVEADTWAKDFLAKTEYCDLTYWLSLASSYNELSAAAKQEIYSAVSDASTDMNYRAQAMARYEKTLSVKSADAFISERQVDSVRPLYLLIVAPKTDTILIVVFSILGVSAIGGYYFVKRKKEDRV